MVIASVEQASRSQVVLAGEPQEVALRARSSRPGMVELLGGVFLPRQCQLELRPSQGGDAVRGVVRKVQMCDLEPTYAIWVQVDEARTAALAERRQSPRATELPRVGGELHVPGSGAVPSWASMLVGQGLLSELELRRITLGAKAQDVDLGDALQSMSSVSKAAVAMCMALDSSVPYVDPRDYEVHLMNRNLLPEEFARKHLVFPLFDLEGHITLGMLDPTDLALIDQVRLRTKRQVDPCLCPKDGLGMLVQSAYGAAAPRAAAASSTKRSAAIKRPATSQPVAAVGEPSVSRRLEALLAEAVRGGASDLHIEPEERFTRVRSRVDGLLHETANYPTDQHAGIISSIKVKARLDIAETRRPQDGNFRISTDGVAVEARVSTIPTVHGENAVLRLLRADSDFGKLGDLCLPAQVLSRVEQLLEQPNGMLLVTGPTGSGKTSTLYAALAHLNAVHRNIVTIEDPVERQVPLLRQTQINPRAGLTFASGLRSMLRQDPDVIMVGEIRDQETAEISIQAALTGHLVLSTLHTNTAADSVVRLTEMGVAPFLITSSLRAVLSQRLARRVCKRCAVDVEPDPQLLAALGYKGGEQASFKRGRGCANCLRTGFRGRVGVYELLELTPELAECLTGSAPRRELRQAARAALVCGLRQDGLAKAAAGITTLEEVARVAGLPSPGERRA